MANYSLLPVPKLDTTTPAFRQALVTRALAAGLDPNLVAAAISFESGFNPRAKNPGSSAVGLIQWLAGVFPAVAKFVGSSATHDDLSSMTAEQQLPFVIGYFQMKGIDKMPAATATDYYMSVLLPAFVGYRPDYVLARKGDAGSLKLSNGKATGLSLNEMYVKNPSFDWNKKGWYTVGDVGKKIEDLVAGALPRAPVLVPLPVTAPPRPRGSEGSSTQRSRPALSARIGSSRTVFRDKEPTGLPTLRRGSHGPAVELLQRLLVQTKAEGEETQPDIDGDFGAQTELHVALHQQDADLAPDGECGPVTWGSFVREEFWGIDRIGRSTPEDPYGELDPMPFAATVPAALPTTARAAVTQPFDLREPPTQRSGKKT